MYLRYSLNHENGTEDKFYGSSIIIKHESYAIKVIEDKAR